MALEIIVNGCPIKQYRHGGRVYVEGRRGKEFTLRVRNDGYDRVKAVVSVDGKNVLDATEASRGGRGYVIEPHSTLEIPGWRISGEKAANFFFSDLRGAYNQDNQANVGVFGICLFRERPRYSAMLSLGATRGIISSGSLYNCSAAAAVCDSAASSNLGTGWGEVSEFRTREVSYDFDYTPFLTEEVYYDDARGLKARGIRLDEGSRGYPQAFPAGDFGCPPPR